MSDVKPKANFTLLRDLIMIMPIKSQYKSDSGLVVVSSDPTAPLEGVVLAIGPGVYSKKGEHIEVPVNVGDRIVFMKSDPTELKHDGEVLLIIKSEDVLCKISKE